jgi:SH3-like domain-containing protein
VLRTSNVREGPGTEFRVIVTLRQGTPLTGYSYKGEWIRIKLEDGTQGWIHQALASNR